MNNRTDTDAEVRVGARRCALRLLRQILSLVVLATSSSASALPVPSLPWDRALDTEAGVWVEYVLTAEEKAVGPWVRFLVLEREADSRWMELWISQRPGSASQAFRIRVGASGRIEEAWLRMMGGEAVRLDPAELYAEASPVAGSEVQAIHRGRSAVLTSAGTFRCDEAQVAGVGTFYTHASVPLFRLVRLRLEGGLGLELVSYGEGASGVVKLE